MEMLNAGLEQAHIISELRERVAHLQRQAAKWEAQVGILAKRAEQLEVENEKIAKAAESGIAKAWQRVEELEAILRAAEQLIGIFKAKLEAMLCADCEKSMLECTCDEESE